MADEMTGLVPLGGQPPVSEAKSAPEHQDEQVEARKLINMVKGELAKAFEDASAKLSKMEHRMVAGFRSTLNFHIGHLASYDVHENK